MQHILRTPWAHTCYTCLYIVGEAGFIPDSLKLQIGDMRAHRDIYILQLVIRLVT